MKSYNVGVVGIGMVGSEMVQLLKKRHFPMRSLTVLARKARTEDINGEKVEVRQTENESFAGLDIAFFAGTEGAKGAAQTYKEAARESGCIVIDNGDDFRMDPKVPLVVPEINPQALVGHEGFIANPNCSTIIALMALAPLHAAARLKRLVACTYQAVSGTGTAAVAELKAQVKAWTEGEWLKAEVYPHQIAFNILPAIGSFKDDSGESTEEQKMRRETHKILGDYTIGVSTTCVRVPVFNGHSIALHAEFEKPLSAEQARMILAHSQGVRLMDEPGRGVYPMPIKVSGDYDVLVGRIREDASVENGLALFCAGDNIWKGAAQNAIQIAELLIKQ